MKLIIISIFTLLGLSLFALETGKKAHRHKVGAKKYRKAVANGYLTKEEAQKLRRSDRRRKEVRQNAMTDGEVTRDEKRKLRKMRHNKKQMRKNMSDN